MAGSHIERCLLSVELRRYSDIYLADMILDIFRRLQTISDERRKEEK
jgi:hypothetical protein